MLSWCAEVRVMGEVEIPIGCYQTVDQAVDDVQNIGHGTYRDGELTLYRYSFPGRFIGAIPVKKWSYKTRCNGTDNEYVELMEIEL